MGFGKKNILVAHNGVDLNIFETVAEKDEALAVLDLNKKTNNVLTDKKILVYTGKFKTKGVSKGIDDILQAAKILNNSRLVFLFVGGATQDIKYYRDLAIKSGLERQAYFFQHQAQDILALFQKTADILLMPFPKIGNYEYPMTPLKMFEYMVSSRPIIASDLPTIREVLNESNCVFCQPDNPKDLADKVALLLGDKTLASKISQQAYDDVKNYTWDKRAERIMAHLQK
jgi:glycosyltransferase involved in cell wall biosynthesis